MNFNTCLLHGNEAEHYPDGATLVPVSQSNAFLCETIEELERVFSQKKAGYAYSRIGNPTVAAFEQKTSAGHESDEAYLQKTRRLPA